MQSKCNVSDNKSITKQEVLNLLKDEIKRVENSNLVSFQASFRRFQLGDKFVSIEIRVCNPDIF